MRLEVLPCVMKNPEPVRKRSDQAAPDAPADGGRRSDASRDYRSDTRRKPLLGPTPLLPAFSCRGGLQRNLSLYKRPGAVPLGLPGKQERRRGVVPFMTFQETLLTWQETLRAHRMILIADTSSAAKKYHPGLTEGGYRPAHARRASPAVAAPRLRKTGRCSAGDIVIHKYPSAKAVGPGPVWGCG